MAFIVSSIIVGGTALVAASAAAGAQGKASKQASQTALQAQDESIAAQERMLDRQIELNTPFREAGLVALYGQPISTPDAIGGAIGGTPIQTGKSEAEIRTEVVNEINQQTEEDFFRSRGIFNPADVDPGLLKELREEFRNQPTDTAAIESEVQRRVTSQPVTTGDDSVFGGDVAQRFDMTGQSGGLLGKIIAGAPTFDEFVQSPEAAAIREQELADMTRATERTAAARGRLFAPSTQLELQDRAMQKTRASKLGQFDNALSRRQQDIGNLLNLVNVGRGATTQQVGNVGAAGTNIANVIGRTAQSVGQNQLAAGQARASGFLNSRNIIGGGISNFAENTLFNRWMGQGGNTGGFARSFEPGSIRSLFGTDIPNPFGNSVI